MTSTSKNLSHWLPTSLYVLLLIYGTLFPLNQLDWNIPVDPSQLFSLKKALETLSFSDLLVNLLIYLPIGVLLFINLHTVHKVGVFKALLLVTLAAFALCTALEYLQLYIPGRVTSFSDILINTAGATAGALLAINLQHQSAIGAQLKQIRATYTRQGPLTTIGLMALFFWSLSELTPLVPSLDIGNLWQGVKPIWKTLLNPASFDTIKTLTTALNLCAIGVLLSLIISPRLSLIQAFLIVVSGVFFLKIMVVGRQLSLEALSGFLLALPIIVLAQRKPSSRRFQLFAIISILAAYLIGGLQIGNGASLKTYAFNWIPFAGQHNGIIGLVDILFNIWPFFILAVLILQSLHTRRGHAYLTMWFGAFFLCLFVLAIEWQQRNILGRYPDATDAYLATAGWLYAFYLFLRNSASGKPTGPETLHLNPSDSAHPSSVVSSGKLRSPPFSNKTTAVYILAGGVLLFGATKIFSLYDVTLSVDKETRTMLPIPDELAAPYLPDFRFQHPRLPSPTFTEYKLLKQLNPDYVKKQRERAKNGRGDYYAIAFTGLTEPFTIDLDTTVKRLNQLTFSYRGHQQSMPLAVAYDWLYPQLSEQQRQLLQNKLAESCNYLINFIRKERLSPYNVFLYNSPFQALVAVSIALYGDHPQGDQCMRFTYELWKNRVLPVWDQVMGENGGWHEGGEYIGIGIGQAIYKVPAMWEHATGEPIFAQHPGIKGFLDFILYRQRPDGTHMRWGDAGFFDKRSAGTTPLAIKFRDKAAYSINGCAHRFEPTAWPWGPLPDSSLCDPKAIQAKPLEKVFDGLGMLIARSDWRQDATYMTFKAGDNYWSHSHLDQGAFTLFKGSALAIDSGLYGTGYDSDHHMQYAYQSIAHNLITITDPADTVAAPGKDRMAPRSIANDGGQRRVGSGWGQSAPIDLNEWLDNSDTYRTGSIKHYLAENDLVIAVAELTPAYTNKDSGDGTFEARTRRVDKYWRTFIYDRRNDVIIIHDDIVASDELFIKRSILHTLDRPNITGNRIVSNPLSETDGNLNKGQLSVSVLFPENAYINLIGGKGAEFFVDGVNFDEKGTLWDKVKQRKNTPNEPGRWRVEISPPFAQQRDAFLMVLKPSLLTNDSTPPPSLEIHSIREEGLIGVTITGPDRHLRVVFPEHREGVIITSREGSGEAQTYDLTSPPPPQGKLHWWQKMF